MLSSSSADILAGIESLLTEILLRLPAKSLIKLKSVCKQWRSLISSAYFIHLHSRRSTPIAGVIFYRWSSSRFELAHFDDAGSKLLLPTPFSFGDSPCIRILQSCNGLLLCEKKNHPSAHFLHNPTTRESLFIPPLPSEFRPAGFNFAFDPSRSSQPSIISVTRSATSHPPYQVNVFDPASRLWRFRVHRFLPPFDLSFNGGVYWNGSLHWIAPTGASLRFDFDAGCMAPMPSIPSAAGRGERRYKLLQESGGYLHLVEVYRGRGAEVKVLEMAGDYSRWFVKYSVDLSGMTRDYPQVIRSYADASDGNFFVFQILCLCRREKEEDSSMVISIPGGRIINYNFVNNKLREVGEMKGSEEVSKKRCSQFEWVDVYPYVQSLASL